MTFSKKAARVLISLLLIRMTIPVDATPQAQAPPSPAENQSEYAPLAPDEIDSLVAPIALYPDSLVAQVLGAATFPDQVTDADSWLKQNSRLTGQPLMQAVDKQSWDPAVKALTQFASVLDDLAKNLAWTSALGEAAATQQQDVMAGIQRMRAKAYAAGNLKSGSQIKVVQESPQTIVIQPANPQIVYVPSYNPTVVYGTPVVVPGYSSADVAAAAIISFGAGIAVGAAMRGGCCGWGWGGWGTNWHGNTIIYNRNVYVGNSYWRGGSYPGYRPGYPAYRPAYPAYRPGYSGAVRPPAYGPGVRPPYSPNRPPVYNGTRPVPYDGGQGARNRPVNPAYGANAAPAAQTGIARPVPRPDAEAPRPRPDANEFRGYPGSKGSGNAVAQTTQRNALASSAGARAQSARGNQSLAANAGRKAAVSR